jgi:hypothetical protein
MKIRAHSESHIVELEDGSVWQIFPGDSHLTLDWRPETDLTVTPIDDELCSHVLLSQFGSVRVIRAGERWPAATVALISKGE